MTDEHEEYNYYEHLIPEDILLDTFCFTTGIELSRFLKIHPYFKNCIQNCTNSLPSMAIKQLEVHLGFRDSERILMRKDDKTVMEFLDIRQFMQFMDEHPMSIELLICWNTIWMPKFLLTLAEHVPIGEVQLRLNQQSPLMLFGNAGRVWYSGRIHQFQNINVNVLMDDYVKFKNINENWPKSFHFHVPNNFECAAIHFENNPNDRVFHYGEIVNWAVLNNYHVPPDGAGRVLILNHYNLDVPVATVVCKILEKIRQKPTTIGPFTLLFKHVERRHLHGANNTIVVEPTRGMQFLAGKLHFNQELKTHSLVNANAEVADGPVPARLERKAAQFAYIVRYKELKETGINEPGLSKLAASTLD